MLHLYTWKTPNGYKVPLLLEELGLTYLIYPIDISKGAQKTPEFLAMNPNHKIPVLIDDAAEGGPLTIFESAAILMYLADLHGKFFAKETRARYLELEWLMFQMASIGPMFGQANHFLKYAPEKIEYAIKRYTDEATRLVGVMETRLSASPYLGGSEYSIADMATWPWVRAGVQNNFVNLSDFPQTVRWYNDIDGRPATKKALEKIDRATEGGSGVCVPSDK